MRSSRWIVVAAVLLTTGCGGGSSALKLHPCTIGHHAARCGRLAVPEDPAAPSGRKIALNVAVIPATGGRAKPDPLFWFAGWGGAGVSDDAANVLPLLGRVNADRDLVFIDQRGTGGSRLACPPSGAQPAQVAAAARRCARSIGPRLRFYTSTPAVDDVDRVRQALGYDRINLYGGSYGVTTGQIYLLRHEAHVRTAVFDSGSLLDVRIFEQAAPNAQRALDRLFARCAADTACHTAYPHLRRDFAAVQARLARAPARVPGTAKVLTPAAFAMAVEDMLATLQGKAILPRAIHLVARGQIRAAAALVGSAAGDTSELAYQAIIQCSEPWASWRPAESARVAAGTFFAPAVRLQVADSAAACRALPRAHVPPAIGRRVRSRAPVLFLAGAEDPADPPANIADARRELPNSRTVVFPISGHGQLGYLCAQNLIAGFVAAGTASGLDTSCAKTAAQPSFDYTAR